MTEAISAVEPTAVEKLKAWVAEKIEVLKDATVEVVIADYSGSGDEGNWDGLSTEPAEAFDKLSLPEIKDLECLMEAACDQLASPYPLANCCIRLITTKQFARTAKKTARSERF
jgi:hypothetical protein